MSFQRNHTIPSIQPILVESKTLFVQVSPITCKIDFLGSVIGVTGVIDGGSLFYDGFQLFLGGWSGWRGGFGEAFWNNVFG